MKQGWHDVRGGTSPCEVCGEWDGTDEDLGGPQQAGFVHVVEGLKTDFQGNSVRVQTMIARCRNHAPRATGRPGKCNHHIDGRCSNARKLS